MRESKRIAILRTVTVFVFPFLTPIVSFAEERIHRYHSEIVVRADGSAQVVETIEVRAEGNAIKRGIFRDILTKRGQKVTFYGAERDDAPDNSRLEKRNDRIRLYVGRADHILAPGDYKYELTFDVTNVVRRKGDRDELYWNVTGNGWTLPIDESSATIMFDADVPFEEIDLAGFTGKTGARGTAYTISNVGVGSAQINTTHSLPPGHGLTFIAGIPKGYFDLLPEPVATPTRIIRLGKPSNPEPVPIRVASATDGKTWAKLATAGIVPLVYFLAVWLFIGRDPLRGRTHTLYLPPDGISPAAARFLSIGGYDAKTFTAAIIHMAINGHLKIARVGKNFQISNGNDEGESPDRDETILLGSLDLADDESLTTEFECADRLLSAAKEHATYLEYAYRGSHFTLNRLWWLMGCALAVVCVGVAIATESFRSASVAAVYAVILVISSGFALHGMVLLTHAIRGRMAYGSNHMHVRHEAGAGALFLLAGGGVSVLLAILLSVVGHVAFAAISIALGIVSWLFFVLMPAPTREGRNALDRIEAFRRSIVKDGVATRNRPVHTDTVSHCEQCFPYAVALDAGYEWAELFNEIDDNDSDYSPSWYEDDGIEDESDLPLYLSRQVGNDFASAIGRVQPPQPDHDFDDWDGFNGMGGGGFGRFGHRRPGHFGVGGFGGGLGGGGFGGSGGGGFGGGGGFSGGGSGGGGGGGW